MRMIFPLVILGFLASCGKQEAVQEYPYQVPEDGVIPVATVGDDMITRAEFDHRLAFYSTNPQAHSSQNLERIANELIDEQVFYKKAIAMGFDQNPEYRLNQRKLLAHEYRKYLEIKVAEAAVVTEQEVEDYYNSHQDKYTKPAMYRVAIYLRRQPDDTSHTYTLKQIADSASVLAMTTGFGKIAETSDHSASRYKGGILPWFAAGTHISGIDKAVFNTATTLTEGEVSRPIKTDYGHYLIRLTDKRASVVTPFEQVKSAIRKALIDQKRKDYLTLYLNQAREEYPIKTYPENMKARKQVTPEAVLSPPGFPVQ